MLLDVPEADLDCCSRVLRLMLQNTEQIDELLDALQEVEAGGETAEVLAAAAPEMNTKKNGVSPHTTLPAAATSPASPSPSSTDSSNMPKHKLWKGIRRLVNQIGAKSLPNKKALDDKVRKKEEKIKKAWRRQTMITEDAKRMESVGMISRSFCCRSMAKL